MPASITLSAITFSTPDGRPLFSDLDLSFGTARTGLLGRNGVGKTTLLRLIAGDLQAQAGSVSVSGSLGILRQSALENGQRTVADLFGASQALALLRRAEKGEAGVDELAQADWTLEARLHAALGQLGLDVPIETRLAALSGGQRTRAALAAVVFAKPDFLLLDEPTNNLDRDGRAAVIDLLANWRAAAIVVSHDRELLDVMEAIVELTSLGATRYGGNWTHYRARKALELEAAQHDLARAELQMAETARTAQQIAERKARKDGAGKRKRARGDLPRIMLDSRQDRSERTGGDNVRLAERQRVEAFEAIASARQRIEILQPLTVQMPSTRLPPGKTVLVADAVTAGYQPDRPILRDLSFSIVGPERLAIAGPNGAGKTTLLALITGRVQPWNGRVVAMTRFALLDQHVSLLDPTLSIRDNFLAINPDADENTCRSALARFMFRAEAALQLVSTLSGGQLLRAGLACVLGGSAPPALLILDEPTNHLDVDSIEAVEAGLRGYDGALIVVSHDETFLEAINITRTLSLKPLV